MIQFATFPRAWSPPPWVDRIVDVFRRHQDDLSADRAGLGRSRVGLLAVIASDLEGLGFRIETLKPTDRELPRLSNGEPARQRTNVDVYHPEWHCCIAIEDRPDWAAIDEDGVEPLLVANADTLCLAVRASARTSASSEPPESDFDRALALAKVLYGRTRRYLPHRLVLIGF